MDDGGSVSTSESIPPKKSWVDKTAFFFLEVLRIHLSKAIIGLYLAVIIALVFGQQVVGAVRRPIDEALQRHSKGESVVDDVEGVNDLVVRTDELHLVVDSLDSIDLDALAHVEIGGKPLRQRRHSWCRASVAGIPIGCTEAIAPVLDNTSVKSLRNELGEDLAPSGEELCAMIQAGIADAAGAPRVLWRLTQQARLPE